MAEPLKNRFGPDIPRKIAAMIEAVDPEFPSPAFLGMPWRDWSHWN
jgi:hypothetical protein